MKKYALLFVALAAVLAVSQVSWSQLAGMGRVIILDEEREHTAGVTAGGRLQVDSTAAGTTDTTTTPCSPNTEVSGSSDADLVAAAASTRLCSVHCRENAGSPDLATVIIRHGATAGGNCTGDAIVPIELGANQTAGEASFDLAVASGVCLDITAGTVECTASTRTEASP